MATYEPKRGSDSWGAVLNTDTSITAGTVFDLSVTPDAENALSDVVYGANGRLLLINTDLQYPKKVAEFTGMTGYLNSTIQNITSDTTIDARAGWRIVSDLNANDILKIIQEFDYLEGLISGMSHSWVEKNSSVTLTVDEVNWKNIIRNVGANTLQLPSVDASNDGSAFARFKNDDPALNLTITTSDADTVNGAVNYVLLPGNAASFVYHDSTTDWILI